MCLLLFFSFVCTVFLCWIFLESIHFVLFFHLLAALRAKNLLATAYAIKMSGEENVDEMVMHLLTLHRADLRNN